jgi:hypothetical protein
MFFGSRLNRLATSIRRGISKYSVGSDNPGLVFDFIDNFYQKDKNQTVNFDGAITHARAGNATMTDGYGPELVTNGSFTDSIDGWSGAGWVWSSRGASYDSGSSVTVALSQDVAVEAGKTYIVTFTFIDVSGGTPSLMDGEQSLQSHSASGNYEYAYIADSSTFELGFRGGTATFYVDNVSVREMPVIKWAPHNLLTYSEDLSQQWTVSGGAVKSSTTETDPAGGSTAALITNLQNADNARINRNLAITEDSAFGVFLKGTAGETINIEHGTDQQTVTLTSDWKLYTLNVTAPQTTLRIINRSGCTADEVYVAFPHVYRSDLGGMVDNPDRGDSYVPTTSSAKQLPRIGHHVYNGSAWVNEGVLAESESRVNLDDYSDFSGAYTETRTTLTANQAVSPDGTENASEITENTATGSHYIVRNMTITASLDYTISVYVKQGSGSRSAILRTNNEGADDYVVFDFATESITETGNGVSNETSQDVGNGWYRIAFTYTQSADASSGVIIALSNSATPSTHLPSYTGDGTSSLFVYGAQLEAGSTPSSYIPTSGQQGTREAETFTIPSANLPWPTPQYIGDELVTNGTFDTDSDWTKGTGWSISGDTASSDGSQTANSQLDSTSNITLEAGKLYLVSYDVVREAGTVSISVTTELAYQATTSSGTYSYEVLATGGTRTVKIRANSSFIGSVDNISVREINPLSVSIGMEGRVTFANTWTSGTKQVARFFRWQIDNDNKLVLKADSTDASGERLTSTHEVNNVADFATFNDFVYEGVLQSVNVALRVGSTFFQVAANGQTGAENATLTSLVDLSATDLDLVDDDYMGTIGTFRVWDKDLGDAGIVEATEPSLEPSLSLTFEGVGTNSFVVNDWSE